MVRLLTDENFDQTIVRVRAILTHDISTLVPDAEELILQGAPMAGVIFVFDQLQIGRAINDLEIALECYSESEIRNAITYIPL